MPANSIKVIVSGDTFEVVSNSVQEVSISNRKYENEFVPGNRKFHRLKAGNQFYEIFSKAISDNQFEIWINQDVLIATIQDNRSQLLSQLSAIASSGSTPYSSRAPMPGLVTTIEARIGDIVHPGQGLLILEAMKMENQIRSPIYGRVKSVNIENKAIVEKDEILMIIEPINTNKNN